MKLFSTSDIQKIDKYTITNEPISSIDLMERAATEVVNEITSRYDVSHKIYIFAGPGNNGGDALVVARLLLGKSYSVFVYLCNPSGKLSPDCRVNKDRLLKEHTNSNFTEIVNEFAPPKLTEKDIIIDGLFGSGLNKPLEGGFAGLVRYINASSAKVISIDIPSGMFGEDNSNKFEEQIIVEAELTLTFQFPKIAFFFAENSPYFGEIKILEIGIHPDAIRQTHSNISTLEKEDISKLLKKREKFSHKGNYGQGLLFAGSFGKMGAAILSATACLRSGIGLLTTHVPECGIIPLQTAVPESMGSIDPFAETITTLPELKQFSAFGVGPGLGTSTQTAAFLENLLATTGEHPIVIDADALNIISTWPVIDNVFPKNCIITPHPKEFDRLAGKSSTSYERFIKAQNFAKKHKVFVILKGAYTTIACPSGECFFNTTGNPGMATAGSGDVLTGIILALLAQEYTVKEAALIGVYLHGLAGDLASEEKSEESMIARDIIDKIGNAFKYLKK